MAIFDTLSPDFRESLRQVADELALKAQKQAAPSVQVRVAMDMPQEAPKPIAGAMAMPRSENVLEGQLVLEFGMQSGDASEYQSFPPAIRYKGKVLAKTGFNSDSLNVVYKERAEVPMIDSGQKKDM